MNGDELMKLEVKNIFFSFGETQVLHGVSFEVEGPKDAQVIIGLEDDAEYEIFIDGASTGTMKTNMGGKLVLSVEAGAADSVPVKVVKR